MVPGGRRCKYAAAVLRDEDAGDPMDVPIDYFTERHWDNVAATRSFDPTDCAEALIESMRENIGDLRGRNILDVGVGNGALAVAFAAQHAKVVGIDLSRRGLSDLNRQLIEFHAGYIAGKAVNLLQMDAQRLGFKDNSFDFVTMLKTIWVFPDTIACLRQLARVLRPGGRLVVQCWETPGDCSLITTGARILGERVRSLQLPAGVTGPFDFTPARLERCLLATGFRDVVLSHYVQDFPVESPDHYWELFRSLAGSAYYAFASQSGAEREAISTELLARTSGARSQGLPRLRLRWMVACATCDGEKVFGGHERAAAAPALRA